MDPLTDLLPVVMSASADAGHFEQALDLLSRPGEPPDPAEDLRRRMLTGVIRFRRAVRLPDQAHPDDLSQAEACLLSVIERVEADPGLAGQPLPVRCAGMSRIQLAVMLMITSAPGKGAGAGQFLGMLEGGPPDLAFIATLNITPALAERIGNLVDGIDLAQLPDLAPAAQMAGILARMVKADEAGDTLTVLETADEVTELAQASPHAPPTELLRQMTLARSDLARRHPEAGEVRRRTAESLESMLRLTPENDPARLDLLLGLSRIRMTDVIGGNPNAARALEREMLEAAGLVGRDDRRRVDVLSALGLTRIIGLVNGTRPDVPGAFDQARAALDEAAAMLGQEIQDDDATVLLAQVFTHLLGASRTGDSSGLDVLIRRLGELAGQPDVPQSAREALTSVLKSAIGMRGTMRNDSLDVDVSRMLPWAGLGVDTDRDVPQVGPMDCAQELLRAMTLLQSGSPGLHGDPAQLEALGVRLSAAVERLPDDSILFGAGVQVLAVVQILLGLHLRQPERVHRAIRSAVTAVSHADVRLPQTTVMAGMAGGLVVAVALAGQPYVAPEEADVWLDQGVELLRRNLDAVESMPQMAGARAGFQGVLGRTLFTRHGRRCPEASGTASAQPDLDESIVLLTAAWDGLREQKRWADAATLGTTLAAALRSRSRHGASGDLAAEAVRIAQAALRLRGRTVLLQSGSTRALEAARDVAGESLSLLRWCLEDDDRAGAVTALETGRGLVLASATAGDEVARLLEQAQEPQLLARWRTEGARAAPDSTQPPATDPASLAQALSRVGAAPDELDLRHRVLAAIERSAPEGWWSRTTSAADVVAAIRRGGAAALAYLVPGEGTRPGAILVVRSDGTIVNLPAAGLRIADDTPVGRFAAAAESAPERRARLKEVSEWAWNEVMRPLLGQVAGPQERLVLVPVGALATIPWHAAGSGGVYAAQLAVISYASSAREYDDACRVAQLPLSAGVLMLASTDASLGGALRSARLAREHLFPGACLLGLPVGRTDGRPSAAALLGALPGRNGNPAALVALGCHATSGADPGLARIVTAPGERLTLGQILDHARSRPAGSGGGVILLTACSSALTVADHDEALTLASGMLAAGARSVVGTRWQVSDYDSSLFSYVLQYFLARPGGLSEPAGALTDAYRWILDPGRPALGAGAAFTDRFRVFLDDPADPGLLDIWAAFAHHGC